MKTYKYWILMAILATPLLVLAIIHSDSTALFLIGTIELILIALVVNTFVIVYSHRNWRANAYGRGLMYSKISLAILADLSIVTGFLGPDWHYRGVVRVVLFAAILIAQARLLHLLFATSTLEARIAYEKEQRDEREEVK